MAELLRTVVSQKLADPVHAGAPAGAKDDIFIIFTKCLWLTEWRKSENTYGPSPDAGRIIDENIDAMKAFASKGGRSQAPTIILSGPGIVWHGTAMQEVATTFFMKCRDAGFPAYPSNAMWLGCSKKSLNGGVVGLERGGHQFMGLVSAFTEYSMSDEVREALALALDFLVEHEYLMKPSESYLSAAKQCGVRAGLTPVDRWSSSEDAAWAEVISAPRTMSSGQCATSHASSAKAPAAAGARASEQQSAPRPNAGKGPQTMAQRVRSSTPPATGRQRLGQAMADFGQSAASRGLSPAVCGNLRGTIPAKPAQACGYSPTTTGGPSKIGGHRIELKHATGKQMLKAKPDPPELPKDAYTADFPSLSKREAANRCRGGATRGPSCAPPKVGGWMPCLSLAAGPPPRGAAPCAKGPEVKAPVVTGAPVPKAAGADALNDGGTRGCAPANSEITHRPEVPPRKAVKSPPASLSKPAKPSQTEPSPMRGDSVPDVAGGDNPQPGDSTPSLLTDASMGEASRPAGRDAQPEPEDAGGAKGVSPSKGGNGNGAEGDSPTLPTSYQAATTPWMGAGLADGDDDPSDPGDHESGPESEYYAPAESADACIVVHFLFRRAGYPPALAAWRNGAWPRRLLYPNQADSIEDALALALWQGLSEDQFFQLLDNASATDRRFGEYDWDFLSKAIVSDTMNADDIHHAGAKALADWAEDNLGPLSIGPRSDLVARFNQMQTERGHPNRESANESSVGPGKQYVPRPPLEDQPNSNQISAAVGRSGWGSLCLTPKAEMMSSARRTQRGTLSTATFTRPPRICGVRGHACAKPQDA